MTLKSVGVKKGSADIRSAKNRGRMRLVLSALILAAVLVPALLLTACGKAVQPAAAQKPIYRSDWADLKRHKTPDWLRDGKFGIYTHWGIYAVPAMGPNATWYSNAFYMREDSWQRRYQEETFGPLSEFGYKDFIPMFTAEKFDPDEWADLFQKSGARFAGPVAEHHDGFAMWDTRWSDWNAARMGPRRDVVGELEKAIKARGMKFVTAFHHAANWFFFPVWDDRYDCANPEYSGLYGFIHERGAEPSPEFLAEWYGKLVEVVDKYDPDFVWFDFALDIIREDRVRDFVAYYYNKALERDKEVVITYKDHDLPPGVGVVDLELGQEPELTHHEWITDTSIDDQGAWGYVKDAGFKSVNRLVDNLVDRVSKNGYLLLNVGPKADGTIPEEAKACLLGIGDWLRVNGEAIYGTSAWTKFGEGPTGMERGRNAMFNEADLKFTAEDIRFTVKGDVLYAIVLDWPGEKVVIKSVVPYRDEDERYDGYFLYEDEILSVTMLGDGEELEWELDREKGLTIQTPERRPCGHAYVFKVVRRPQGGMKSPENR
jgi:alpha-L-fucosidase